MPQLDIFAFNSILYTSIVILFFLYGVSVRFVLPSLFEIVKFRTEREKLFANSSDLLLDEISMVFAYSHSLGSESQSFFESEFRLLVLNTYLGSQIPSLKLLND